MMCRAVLMFAALSVPVAGFAQAPVSDTSKPKSLPHFAVSFQNVVVAKASADKTTIVLLVPQYKMETRTGTYSVVVPTTEKRIRAVTDEAGNTKEVEYTVMVPRTEERTREYTVSIPTEPIKVTLPVAEVRAWQATGEPVESAELLRRVAEPAHLFAVEADPSQKFSGVDPYFAEVLRPGALVLFVAPGKMSGSAPGRSAPVQAIPGQAPAAPVPPIAPR